MGQKLDKAARGAYDAIVYIDGSEVVAEDANGRKIASGVAGTADSAVLQAVVNLGGYIVIKPGAYSFVNINVTVANTIIESSSPMIPGETYYFPLANTVYITSAVDAPIFNILAIGVAIRGMHFYNCYTGIYGFSDIPGTVRSIFIENNVFKNVRGNAIELYGTHQFLVGRVNIENNFFENAVATNFAWVRIESGPSYGTTFLTITKNTFESGCLNHVKIVSTGGKTQIHILQDNYHENAIVNASLIYISCSSGTVELYGGIQNSYFFNTVAAKNIDIITSVTGSVIFYGPVAHNDFAGGDIYVTNNGDANYLSSVSGLVIEDCYLSTGIISITEPGASLVHNYDITIRHSYVSHITIDKCRTVKIIDNIHRLSGTSLWNITNCGLVDIMGNNPLANLSTYYLTITTTGSTQVNISRNSKYPTNASGSSTGTGSEQTIAHGLSAIPTGCKAWIKYLVGARYTTEMVPFDATNIYPTVETSVAYEWRIE